MSKSSKRELQEEPSQCSGKKRIKTLYSNPTFLSPESAHSTKDLNSFYDSSSDEPSATSYPTSRLGSSTPSPISPSQISLNNSAAASIFKMDIDDEVNEQCLCIGSIHVAITSSILEYGATSKRLDLNPSYGTLQVVSAGKQTKYQGMVKQPASACLDSLLATGKLQYEAYLPDREWTTSSFDGLQLVVDLYAKEKDRKEIGHMLGRDHFYLQDPYKNARKLEYINPQELQISTAALELLLAEGFDFAATGDHEKTGQNNQTLKPLGKLGLLKREDEVSELFASSSATEVETRETFIQTSHRIVTELKRHQVEGLRWMLQKEAASTASIGSGAMKGGILADDMGMGKTLSMLALIMTATDGESDMKWCPSQMKHTTLIICPKSVVTSWEEQIQLHTCNVRYLVADTASWHKQRLSFGDYDIIICSYGQIPQKKSRLSAALFGFHFRRIILDEAHIIRERKTDRAKAVFALSSDFRWCITGTPVQNKLDDFGSLLEFIAHKAYGSRQIFQKEVIKPLLSQNPIALPKLKLLISETTLRRLKANANLDLPSREDRIEKLTFTELEKNLHDHLHTFTKNQIERAVCDGAKGTGLGSYMTQLILRLRQVCNHGVDLLPPKLQQELFKLDSSRVSPEVAIRATFDRMICDFCNRSEAKVHADSPQYMIIDAIDQNMAVTFDGVDTNMFDCQHVICTKCNTEEGECPLCSSAAEVVALTPQQQSTKVRALIQNLRLSDIADSSINSVVFSCWTKMLDLVQRALAQEGIKFVRMDGSLDLQTRRERVGRFRNDPNCRVLLSSLGTGSVGLDLTVASHVHLLEPQFNPMLEEQALARVHRIGQLKPVTTIRYIMEGSYEEQILERQNQKLQLAELCASGTMRTHRHLEKFVECLGPHALTKHATRKLQ